jgi:hypothetical protein
MISRAQQILLKRAQSQAGLSDADYRQALSDVTALPQCRSSKDPRLTDDHVDSVLSYFEAIYWRAVDSGTLQPPCNRTAVFQKRGYWASKNQRGNTSRDRYTAQSVPDLVNSLEQEMFNLGFGLHYCQAIKSHTTTLRGYIAALNRTLSAKRNSTAPKASPEVPF